MRKGFARPVGVALTGVSLLMANVACSGGAASQLPTSSSVQAGAGYGFGPMMRAAPSGYRLSRLTCSAPLSWPGTEVFVMLGDMGMSRMMGGVAPLGQPMMLRAAPSRVHAGNITFVVANMGWRTHELVVLPLRQGQRAGERVPGPDGKVSEAGSVGEASASCAGGAGDGIQAGSVGWVTLTLSAGHYELICNLPNHYTDGMHQEFDVAE